MLARLHYYSRSSNLKLFLVLIPEKEQDHHDEVTSLVPRRSRFFNVTRVTLKNREGLGTRVEVTIHSPNGIIHNVLII